MKVKLAIAFIALSSLAFAQHGRPAGGGSPASGAGSTHMGGSGMPGGSSNMGGNGSNHGPGQPNAPAGHTPSDILANNSKLSSNLQSLLPAGTTAQQACSGFKNLGQCVAAIHVSHNLGISFDDLKAKTTGDGAESLGKAIGDLKPAVDAKAEAKKAKKQADADLRNNS
jgi:hypothetical protein